MADRIRVKINYYETEDVEVTPLGGELYRVHQAAVSCGGIAREDVVRLVDTGGGGGGHFMYFPGVVEASGWYAFHGYLPREAMGTPPVEEFRRLVEAHGCVWEGTSKTHVVVSLPPGSTFDVEGAYQALLMRTTGLTPQGLNDRIVREERQDRARREARHRREDRARRRAVWVARLGRGTLWAAGVATVVCLTVMAAIAFVHADAARRPVVAALALVPLSLPMSLLGRSKRSGGAPWMLLVLGAPLLTAALLWWHPGPLAYRVAGVVGVAYVIMGASVGIMLGIFSGFSSSARQMRDVLLFVSLPSLGAAATGLALTLSAARAAVVTRGAASGANLLALAVTAFLLYLPASMGVQALTSTWGRGRRLLALAMVPLAFLSFLRRLIPALIAIWAIAWLVGRVLG